MTYLMRKLAFLALIPLSEAVFAELAPSNHNEGDIPTPYRLTETEGSYRLAVNLPGVKREDLRVSVDYSNNVVELVGQISTWDKQIHGRLRGETKQRQYRQRWQVEDNSVDLFELVMERQDTSLTICVPKPLDEQGRISHLGRSNQSSDTLLQPPGGAARRLNIHVCQQHPTKDFAL